MTPETPPPPSSARPTDLSEAEFAELDELFDATPEPHEPLDAVMLDGYLCGVIVQPTPLEPADWLPWVFDEFGEALAEPVDADWRDRTTALVLKRHAALLRAIVEDGWFEPLLYEAEDSDEADDADAAPAADAEPGDDDPYAALDPIQKALLPWIAGFMRALEAFPALVEMEDEAAAMTLSRVLRHMPPQSDEQRDVIAVLDRELPVHDIDAAVSELVDAVVELQELTRDARYRVEPVRRETPKVGRNDPCPCGSGKKFKQCHGRG